MKINTDLFNLSIESQGISLFKNYTIKVIKIK